MFNFDYSGTVFVWNSFCNVVFVETMQNLSYVKKFRLILQRCSLKQQYTDIVVFNVYWKSSKTKLRMMDSFIRNILQNEVFKYPTILLSNSYCVKFEISQNQIIKLIIEYSLLFLKIFKPINLIIYLLCTYFFT